MRHSRAGLWGTGIYFAVDASYSDVYAFTNAPLQFFQAAINTGTNPFGGAAPAAPTFGNVAPAPAPSTFTFGGGAPAPAAPAGAIPVLSTVFGGAFHPRLVHPNPFGGGTTSVSASTPVPAPAPWWVPLAAAPGAAPTFGFGNVATAPAPSTFTFGGGASAPVPAFAPTIGQLRTLDHSKYAIGQWVFAGHGSQPSGYIIAIIPDHLGPPPVPGVLHLSSIHPQHPAPRSGWPPAPPAGNQQIFLCTVLVGTSTELPSDRSLHMPPVRSQKADGSVQRFDSVKGHTQGTDVFILYDNGQAKPTYLVTYR
jgi:hypothetical protein